tara:strand:- start:216 stop:812 length:597 start_codon:yes stop_codon:yes gene_type:complete
MVDDKVLCMRKAREYEFDYWDGERRFGYGGYLYIPGRWKPVAEGLIAHYQLGPGSKVLDVGCGKGFLLHELKLLEPEIEIHGFDCSHHALNNAKEEVRSNLTNHRAETPLPYPDNAFDLVISLGTLHNLRLHELAQALQEIQRVGCKGYIMVEGYRDEQELFNLQCWALTAESFFHDDEWIWLFKEHGYTGDYEFIYF